MKASGFRTLAHLCWLTVLGSFSTFGADWSVYKPISLSQALARAEVGVIGNGKTATWSFEGAPNDHKFLIKAAYTGRTRKMGATRMELISKWGKSLKSQDFAQHFQDEVEVRADGLTVWLGLQDVLVEPFRREVKPGAQVQVYMMYIGAAGQDRVFFVNEFQAIR